jgi:hypothetical protein
MLRVLRPDVERRSVALRQPHDARVTGEPTRHRDRQRRAVIELAPAFTAGQCVGVDVHHDLVPIPTRPRAA